MRKGRGHSVLESCGVERLARGLPRLSNGEQGARGGDQLDHGSQVGDVHLVRGVAGLVVTGIVVPLRSVDQQDRG